MKVLFVHRMVHQDPLGIMYLSAALRRAGHEVHFADAALEPAWMDRAVRLKPGIVGYSALTGSQGFFLDANRALKRRMDFLSVWGGPHPTFFPEFIEEDGVDVVCVGEGEGAIVDLAGAMDAGADTGAIPNLHVKTGSGIARNDPRPLVEDLDSLPLPDRGILERYPEYRCSTTRSVIASRGCPFSCTFCYNARYREMMRGKGRYARHRGVDSVIEECVLRGDDPWTTQIIFKDDLFAHDEGFVAEFADRYAREVRLPFLCNVRADRMTERMAADLARAGARVVHFGVESGSDRVRREILRRHISREDMLNTARWLRERGVKVYTFNIVGIPGETQAEALETLEFNASLRPDMAVFTMFQPYPRTPLGERAVAMGWCDPGYGGFRPSYYENSMQRLPGARRYTNMVHLFPAATRSALLRWMMPGLLPLPVTPAYRAADFVYKSVRFVFALEIVPLRDVALYSGRWVPTEPGPRPRAHESPCYR